VDRKVKFLVTNKDICKNYTYIPGYVILAKEYVAYINMLAGLPMWQCEYIHWPRSYFHARRSWLVSCFLESAVQSSQGLIVVFL